MKIALVTLSADPQYGKAERNLLRFASALAMENQTTILHHIPLKSEGDTNLYYLRLGRLSGSFATRYKDFITEVDRKVSIENYNIVHAIVPVLRCNVYQPYEELAQKTRRRGLSRILPLIGNRSKQKQHLYAEVERKLLSLPKPPFVICSSKRMKQSVESTINFDPDRVWVLPR